MKFATTLLVAASLLSLLQGCAATMQPASASRLQPGQPLSQCAVTAEPPGRVNGYFVTATSKTQATVDVEGRTILYCAWAGRIIVHGPGWHDAGAGDRNNRTAVPPEAAMFYVAYLKEGETAGQRPITFLFDGGPGSSTVWLHMGGLGPRRVVTRGNAGNAVASSRFVNNEYSLLDASDLVFVDAPGTGFGRIRGKNGGHAFFGTDADVRAFAGFITQFLSKYDRWSSPKYLVGEGYGALRAAALINVLETQDDVDFNGIIFLSQILNFELLGGSSTLENFNPGMDLSYELALPSFAATAWYQRKLPGGSQPLEPLLLRVERFSLTTYAQALREGALLPLLRRDAVAEQLHEYTGLSVSYIEKADLRIDSGEFEHELLGGSDKTTGELDARIAGPSLDPLGERAGYDPQVAAASSAIVSAFNHYVRGTLHYGYGMTYTPEISLLGVWNFWHKPPGQSDPVQQWPNVMPDLANAMKYDPGLKVMLNAGYFDLATPFMNGWYEMHQLQIPPKLQANISYDYYRSGHMACVDPPALERLHDNIAAFIVATDHASDRM
jgi:carboxypeptidase C (cathepsin A)